MADPRKSARVFKALSAETRVKIVQLLKRQALCVNALASRLEVSPAAVSQHLRVLRDAELVEANRQGYYIHYRINEKTLAQWKDIADGLLGAGPA